MRKRRPREPPFRLGLGRMPTLKHVRRFYKLRSQMLRAIVLASPIHDHPEALRDLERLRLARLELPAANRLHRIEQRLVARDAPLAGAHGVDHPTEAAAP